MNEAVYRTNVLQARLDANYYELQVLQNAIRDQEKAHALAIWQAAVSMTPDEFNDEFGFYPSENWTDEDLNIFDEDEIDDEKEVDYDALRYLQEA